MNDRELIEAVLRRDALAWAEFVRRYEGILRTEVRLVAGTISDEDVDDVLGDLWLRLVEDDLRHIRAFDEPKELVDWLKLLVGQLTAKYLRGQRRQAPAATVTATNPDTELLTPKEVGERLRVSTKQAYRLIRAHMAPLAVGTRTVRVSRRELDEFIRRRSCPTDSTSAARFGTAGTTTDAASSFVARRNARTNARRSSSSAASSSAPRIRPVFPRPKAKPPSPERSTT